MNMLVGSLTFLPLLMAAFAHFIWAFGFTWPIRDEALLVRTVVAVDSPDGGSFEQTTDSSDYRTVDDIKVAFHVVNTTPTQTVTVQLDKVEHNVPVDDAIFVKK